MLRNFVYLNLSNRPWQKQPVCKGGKFKQTWPQGYKTFFMLSSIEHKISTAQEN